MVSPEHRYAPRWQILTCCISSIFLQNRWSWALRRIVSCCSFFWSSRHCKTRPRRCVTSTCRALHMQPAPGDASFPSPHGKVGLRQVGCRDMEGSQARFECKARSCICHKKKTCPECYPSLFPTWQTSSRQGQQATSPSVFDAKSLASSFSWEGCSCPPITKIHLVYPHFPKHRICASSWDRKPLELGSLAGCNFSLIFYINSSSHLTTNSAF